MFTFVFGGAASGKSEYAEALAVSLAGSALPRFYLATMRPMDEESRTRIARHRTMRQGKSFQSLECPHGLGRLCLPERGVVLLECLSTLAANEQFSLEGAGENAVCAILEGVKSLLQQSEHLVVVSNSIFSDGIFYDPNTQRYLQNLGFLHQRFASWANYVVEVVAGIPLVIKDSEKERPL